MKNKVLDISVSFEKQRMTQEQPTPHSNQRQQIERLRREIKEGIEQADRGELLDGETVFANIRAKSQRRRRI